jgi:type II secretory pathway pseudopilin PulG
MKFQKSFTLIELLVIVGIMITLTAISVPAFHFFQSESKLSNSAEEITNALRLTQNKTLASEKASQWGVYFTTSTQPHQYTLFEGSSFASRATSSDEVHQLPKLIEIYEIDLWGGNEVIFEKVTGYTSSTSQIGKVSIRLKDEPSKTKTIYVENSGLISLTSPSALSDQDRLKDSRHVHFDYTNRQISTSTEKIILTFTYDTSSTTKEIIIADNIKDNQIYWGGEVDAGGEIQKIKIHTHILNDSLLGTRFCIHRDRRQNSRALKVEISGDVTGDLIQYNASGQTTKGTSIYVSEPSWQ